MGVISLLSIFTRTIIIYILLTVVMKIMGKRRIGELEADELVSTLLVSEIAAMPISDSDIPLLNALIPIIFVCAVEVAISAIKNKSQRVKRAVEGEPVYIIYRGRLLADELLRNRLSVNEILAEMRSQGIADISMVYYAILEVNGKLSLIKREDADDMGHVIIIDGKVNDVELRRMGRDKRWLEHALNGVDVESVLLLTACDSGNINIIKKEGK